MPFSNKYWVFHEERVKGEQYVNKLFKWSKTLQSKCYALLKKDFFLSYML